MKALMLLCAVPLLVGCAHAGGESEHREYSSITNGTLTKTSLTVRDPDGYCKEYGCLQLLREDPDLMFVQLQVAVLQNDSTSTQRQLFCHDAKASLISWQVDPAIRQAIGKESPKYARAALDEYGQALRCWKGSSEKRQTALKNGRQLLKKIGHLQGVFNAKTFDRQDRRLPKQARTFASLYLVK